MRPIIILLILAMAATVPCFGADYAPITKDNEVASVDDVQVGITVEAQEILTLRYLKTRKAVLQGQLDAVNAEIAKVQPEAEKVQLRVEAVEP